MATPRNRQGITSTAVDVPQDALAALTARIEALERAGAAAAHAPATLPPALATFVQSVRADQRLYRRYQAVARRLQGSTNGLLTDALAAMVEG